jgi:hypothetical protein
MAQGNQIQRGIPQPVYPDPPLQISFKYFECDSDRYALRNCTPEYWDLLIRELKRYGSITVSAFEFCDNQYARHTVDPNEEGVDGAEFVGLMEDFDYSNVWQFGVGPRARGFRVVGILVSPTFFVIRLDPNHQTYA